MINKLNLFTAEQKEYFRTLIFTYRKELIDIKNVDFLGFDDFSNVYFKDINTGQYSFLAPIQLDDPNPVKVSKCLVFSDSLDGLLETNDVYSILDEKLKNRQKKTGYVFFPDIMGSDTVYWSVAESIRYDMWEKYVKLLAIYYKNYKKNRPSHSSSLATEIVYGETFMEILDKYSLPGGRYDKERALIKKHGQNSPEIMRNYFHLITPPAEPKKGIYAAGKILLPSKKLLVCDAGGDYLEDINELEKESTINLEIGKTRIHLHVDVVGNKDDRHEREAGVFLVTDGTSGTKLLKILEQTKNTAKEITSISTDTGTILIGDLINIHKAANEDPEKYDEVFEDLIEDAWDDMDDPGNIYKGITLTQLPHRRGKAVIAHTGWGDGTYPIKQLTESIFYIDFFLHNNENSSALE